MKKITIKIQITNERNQQWDLIHLKLTNLNEIRMIFRIKRDTPKLNYKLQCGTELDIAW